MYALAINGSPRKGGNTEILLQAILNPLEEAGWGTELIQIGGKILRGCTACGKCFETKNKKCILAGDDLNGILAKMLQADAIIIGSPTYFGDVTAEVKALIDRAGYVSAANGRMFRGKIGAAAIAVRRGGAIHAYDTINHLFMASQMIIPGSTYWNMGYGMAKGEVEEDAEALRNMEQLGEAIDWLGNAIKPHLNTYPGRN